MPLPLSNPASAPPQMRGIVRGLAQQFPTAIISGRGREKVENFVQLKELYYAGSHGMDIAGPQVRGEGRGRGALYCRTQQVRGGEGRGGGAP